jgi:hypothetical protein
MGLSRAAYNPEMFRWNPANGKQLLCYKDPGHKTVWDHSDGTLRMRVHAPNWLEVATDWRADESSAFGRHVARSGVRSLLQARGGEQRAKL